MTILKHGDADIIKESIIHFTCSNCDCEFTATKAELEVKPKQNLGELFSIALGSSDAEVTFLYEAFCPECGHGCIAEKK